MLDVGFSELLVFGVIALLVLGPEKLPEAARFAAKWYSKFKRAISSVQNDIDRELRLSELREQMNQEMQRIHELEEKMQRQMQELQQQANQPLVTEPEITPQPSSSQYQYIEQTIPMLYVPQIWLQYHSCSSVLILCTNTPHVVPEFQVAV
ncbi:Sec-independent protein translocase protein TatB [Acinetobacter rudis]|uniref:Sec-independent protein translocase protein TatB n=1 Tax=Acinetobacter rudis CIP 110305 TaxID=421052 RepID=S3NPM9_9GAMM|nr:Sec-independent protein translocase protein TatB [Acinetobacter rudis]EPF80363.1 twin arginine-targeting protein translocase TatB [Acinetobacter rudis CIP 110305]